SEEDELAEGEAVGCAVAYAAAGAGEEAAAVAEAGAAAAARGAHSVLRTGGELFVPLADLIDVDRERERLSKELERVQGMLRGTEAKLSDEQFVGRAPEPVIQREREKAASLKEQADVLEAKLEALT
ncbi:MAG: hypothetical protein ACT443_10020, partial [Gemmatimonadota bacterium]